jgi:hypothetical protein
MMGTPARSRVWICRENSSTSMCSTFCLNSLISNPAPLPALSAVAVVGLISIGTTPLPDKLIGDRAGRGTFQDALHDFSGAVAAAVGKAGHLIRRAAY